MKHATSILTALVLFVACDAKAPDAPDTQTKTDKPGTPIAASNLAKRIESGNAPAILDVRTDDEFKQGHVPGAIHIPFDELADRLAELPIKKSDEVVVYCKKGGRAGRAEKTLADAGYTNVRDMTGHWTAWAAGKYAAE